MAEISILLGAGFSVNKGYPTANQLNNRLTELTAEDFWVASEGTVLLKDKSEKDPNRYSINSKHKNFVVDLILHYCDKVESFNYEEFYDFYNNLNPEEKGTEFDEFCTKFRKEYSIDTDNLNFISQTNKIFNQLISLFIVDSDGNKFYESIHYCKPTFPGYTGFLNCLENWGNECTTHIHTLNHDIFFETLSSSDWVQGSFSDGFEEMGSKYYGGIKGNVKVRYHRFLVQ